MWALFIIWIEKSSVLTTVVIENKKFLRKAKCSNLGRLLVKLFSIPYTNHRNDAPAIYCITIIYVAWWRTDWTHFDIWQTYFKNETVPLRTATILLFRREIFYQVGAIRTRNIYLGTLSSERCSFHVDRIRLHFL